MVSNSGRTPATTVGVLAVQGAVEAHRRALDSLGVPSLAVRRPVELDQVAALILPGGESTTISMLLASSGLAEPLAERLADGMPALGTCAGMVLLASEVLDGRRDQRAYGAIDITVRRNAFGRQVDSFETKLAVAGLDGGRFPATFIRAPVVEKVGDAVEVVACVDSQPVCCRQGSVMVTAFHPELVDDRRIHDAFLQTVSG